VVVVDGWFCFGCFNSVAMSCLFIYCLGFTSCLFGVYCACGFLSVCVYLSVCGFCWLWLWLDCLTSFCCLRGDV